MSYENISSSWLGGVTFYPETKLVTSMLDFANAINVSSEMMVSTVWDANSTLATGNDAASESDATPTPDYEYEIEDSLENYDWSELIPTVLVYSLVLLLGISGNGKSTPRYCALTKNMC